MVASKGVAPGAFWPVSRTLVGCLRTLTCPCPRMAAQDKRPPEVRDACRHIKAVIAFENKRLARPVAPPNVDALVGEP